MRVSTGHLVANPAAMEYRFRRLGSSAAGADGGEDFWGAETIRTMNITSVLDELFKGGDADFEELV